MRIALKTFLLSLILTASISAQGKMITVVGDSLVGRVIDGKSIREVIGNVIMTQSDIRITCEKALQYITENRAHLIGNVVITQDDMTILTDEGYYLGDDEFAYSEKPVTLDNDEIHLTASKGYYYSAEKKAHFIGNVVLVDSPNTLNSNRLFYFVDDEKIDAAGNVFIYDTSSSISADSLIYLKKEESTYAFGNVRIRDKKNNNSMLGDTLTDLKIEKYSKITGNPLFIQIDTTDSGQIDTLLISSVTMEQRTDSTRKFIATDSVKIFRGNFSSINDKSILFTDEDRILTVKETDESMPPILWYERSQLVGDSVNIFLEKNQLEWIDVRGNASIISKSEYSKFRFDQISGDNIRMYFNGNAMERTEVDGSVLSIYYVAEGDEPSGLIKSSSTNAIIYFDDSAVSDVRLYGSPVSEYHPENLIEGKEKDFTLPTFKLYEGRPKKEELLHLRKFE